MAAARQLPAQPEDVHSHAAAPIRPMLWSGVIIGIGVIGSLDEIVLHQLLQWHTFYVHTTPYWRIVSDGIFHFVSSALLLGGAMLLAWYRPLLSDLIQLRTLLAGMLLGMGGFNLYDGTIQHKILQLHPVREGVTNSLPYDLAFNALALVLLLLGWWQWRMVRTGYARNSA